MPGTQTSTSVSGPPKASPSVASAPGGLTFFALRRKTTGECAVVAGAEGISSGDTVYGAFPDFGRAHEALTAECGGKQPEVAVPSDLTEPGRPLTADRLYEPDETITRGKWGTVARIGGNPAFAKASEGGQALGDGFFTHPGVDGPTEIVYLHDGSNATLRGKATVLDCVDSCGQLGTVKFIIRGDGQEIWASELIRHHNPGTSFAIDLENVHELRLITTDGGDGTSHDWAAWLDLEIGKASIQKPARAAVATLPPPVGGASILAVPRYTADESTAGAFVIDLSDGSVEFVDRVNVTKSTARRRAMNHNVFAALGRAAGDSANPGGVLAGEIRSATDAVSGLFLVDTSSGTVAYFGDLVDEPHRATYRRVNGRPAEAIASGDGNFALIMRRDGSGATVGAYLYHATTGECVYFDQVNKMGPDPVVMFASVLPKMEGRVAAAAVQDGGETTTQAVLVDEASGAVYMVGGLDRKPTEISVARQELGLFEFFPSAPEVASPQRFVLVPGFSDNGATDAIFVVDAGTGRMAVLKDVRRPGGMRLVGSTKSLSSHLPVNGDAARALSAVPKVGASGTTDGAWIFDSTTGTMLVLESVRGPQNLQIHRVDE